ncbi:MAG: hypothetical protein IPN43_11015 [Chitinophagaceae bacterium]|nr:hypothetical protein [Chitinophagaceae bacterium]
MAEGRVRNEGGGYGLSMKMEYFITDHQGNTRVSFEDNGTNTNTAHLTQENSYYAFGMQMAGSYMPTNANKKLYNAGSEWQDDIEGLADYYSTFYREYDPIIGRFNSVDPLAAATDNMTTYAYANNNPIMMNDPMGDYAEAKDLPKWIRDMQADYKSWHDSRYGNNFFDRGWDFGGDGDGDGGGGGGFSEFDFWSTYGGLKSRQRNDPRAEYDTNEWGEFGYWLRDRSYAVENGSKTYDKDDHLTNQTYGEVGMIADRWVSFGSTFSQPLPRGRYFRRNLRSWMHPQEAQNCVPAIFSYANSQLCNGNVTREQYQARYLTQFPGRGNIPANGVPSDILQAYINQNFTNTPFRGIVAAINAGNPVLWSIPDPSGSSDFHEILIVGYDERNLNRRNFNIYFMDPAEGSIQTRTNTFFNSNRGSHDPTVLTGCR